MSGQAPEDRVRYTDWLRATVEDALRPLPDLPTDHYWYPLRDKALEALSVLVSQRDEARLRAQSLAAALREIGDLPSDEDLLTNPLARAAKTIVTVVLAPPKI